LPRFSHPSALPALDPQVAPQSRSSCSVSRCGCRLPRTPHLRVLPAFDLQVALNSNPFGASSGFQVPGSPATLFRPLRLSMHHGLPRSLHLPALPAIDHRVSPTFVSFSASGASASGLPAASLFQLRFPTQVPSCPGPCIFRLYRQRIFELPRISRSSAPPVLELSVSLELRSPRPRLPMMPRVSPQASSSGLASGLILRVPPASLSLGVG